MDLLELNDIYYRDKTRIEHDDFFKDPVRVEYSFTPLEEHLFSTGDGRISAVVNKPFIGISSVMLNHNIHEFLQHIHEGTYVTDYLFGADAHVCNDASFSEYKDRVKLYDDAFTIGCQYHPDITFSDDMPGMTLIMDRMKNTNFEFSPDKGTDNLTAYNIDGIQEDARSLSLIYIQKNGDKKYGYGGVIYTGRGLKSLDDELKMYLFSNTYIVARSPEMNRFPDMKTMKTSCVIAYEDSIYRILNAIEQERE